VIDIESNSLCFGLGDRAVGARIKEVLTEVIAVVPIVGARRYGLPDDYRS